MATQTPRFANRYSYDHGEMLDDSGHDLCPVGHQKELAFHLGTLLDKEREAGTRYGDLPPEEQGTSAFACLVHDIGEDMHPHLQELGFIVVGDIASGKKTSQDRANERAIRVHHFKQLYDDVEPAVMKKVDAMIAHEDDSDLYDLYEAAHGVQTLETANYAHLRYMETNWARQGDVIDITSQEGARLSGLLGMSRVVASTELRKLERYSHFVYVAETIAQTSALRTPQHALLH